MPMLHLPTKIRTVDHRKLFRNRKSPTSKSHETKNPERRCCVSRPTSEVLTIAHFFAITNDLLLGQFNPAPCRP